MPPDMFAPAPTLSTVAPGITESATHRAKCRTVSLGGGTTSTVDVNPM